MADAVIRSIANLTSYSLIVNNKLSSLLKTHDDQTLRSIQTQMPKYRRALQSVRFQLQSSPTNSSALQSVKSQDDTLLSFTSAVLVASTTALRQLRVSLKNIKHNGEKKSLLKKASQPVADNDLMILDAKLQFLEKALQMVTQLIILHFSTTATKIHLHAERLQYRAIEDTVAEIQSSEKTIVSLTAEGGLESCAPGEDFSKICTSAKEIARTEIRKVEAEVTKIHSGFSPMSPLVEVKTNITLMPSITAATDLNI